MPWRILPSLARPKCLACSTLTPCSATSCMPNRPHRRRRVLSSRSSAPSAEITGIQESSTRPSFPHRGCLFPPPASTSNTSTTLIPTVSKRDDNEKEGIDEQSMSTVSRAASLERFEYESWSSSPILEGDEVAQSSFFDLPLELIRSTQSNGTDSPVKAAFVFDQNERKGPSTMRKTMTSSSLESSNRHVKFSTSPYSCPPSPSSACISPTMQKAKEEFHAFLEARTA